MQSASAEFETAAESGAVTRTAPTVEADWAQDGYGGAGTIDDLSPVAGPFTVNHMLDDGWPDDVTTSNQSTPAEASVPMTAGLDGTSRPSSYFSPFGSSPVAGYERDVAPMRIKSGLVTSAGPEEVTIFTGQMVNTPISTGAATVNAVSATLLKLKKLVQPPAVRTNFRESIGGWRYKGISATWPVSWALAECGIYTSPPPRAGCRFWLPMHGALAPFLSDTNDPNGNTNPRVGAFRRLPGGSVTTLEPAFIPGPYVLATDAAIGASGYWGVSGFVNFQLEDGEDMLSKAGSRGRVEFYVRGDSYNVNAAPGGSGAWATYGVVYWLHETGSGSSKVAVGLGTDRKMYVRVHDGTNDVTAYSTGTLPTDGAWHRVGGAWDVPGNKLWTLIDNTAESVTPGVTLSTTNLPDVEDMHRESATALWVSMLPVAEVQVTTGDTADVDLTPTWIGDGFTAGAVVGESTLELVALVETAPREAYEFIHGFARGEAAAVWIDESDVFHYLPRSHWAQPAQQEVTEVLSTETNISHVPLTYDPLNIRNAAGVTYTQTRIDEGYSHLIEMSTVLDLPPGVTTARFALDVPAVVVLGGSLDTLSQAQVLAPPAISGFITVNSSASGSGTYATEAEVYAEVIAWTAGEITVAITNTTTSTWYLTNETASSGTATTPFLAVSGFAVRQTPATLTTRESLSVATRGERAMTVDAPAVQREQDAYRLARNLVLELCVARPYVDGLGLFADPRRQPGDLVTVTDPVDIGLTMNGRLMSISHTLNGPDYRQTARVAPAMDTFVWGISRWGQSIWGPEA